MKYITLSTGEKYPISINQQEGATAQFLINSENILQIFLKNMSNNETRTMQSGILKAGFLYRNGVILWLFQFDDDKKPPLLTLEAPFDVRIIPSDILALPSIDDVNHQLTIQIHAVDEKNTLRVLRVVTMPNQLSLDFLSCVRKQLLYTNDKPVIAPWRHEKPSSLALQCHMHVVR